MTIVRPETLVRWHREGFRRYWRWKSRPLRGRPPIGAELRALIRRMSLENPLWGAPRIHGELLKLGFVVASRPSASIWRGGLTIRSKLFLTLTDTFCLRDQHERQQQFAPRPFN
jgi:hypothetical protein